VKLFDLLDRELLFKMLDNDYVKKQVHPTAPYFILNYTEKCTWDEEWNEVTLQCRGMIVHSETYEIIARPLRKFFNHDQPQAPQLHLDDQVMVFDKADGSLGILYRLPDAEMAVATRGSFTSDQALWATNWLKERGTTDALWRSNWTYLFEIIYPENRIVVDYRGFEGLGLLGAIDN
jgi:RNA ligase